jgi:hypothetical protein
MLLRQPTLGTLTILCEVNINRQMETRPNQGQEDAETTVPTDLVTRHERTAPA